MELYNLLNLRLYFIPFISCSHTFFYYCNSRLSRQKVMPFFFPFGKSSTLFTSFMSFQVKFFPESPIVNIIAHWGVLEMSFIAEQFDKAEMKNVFSQFYE